jgi:hypothetical protein
VSYKRESQAPEGLQYEGFAGTPSKNSYDGNKVRACYKIFDSSFKLKWVEGCTMPIY